MADLITLAYYRTASGIDPTDTRDDARISQWIPAVSNMIRAWTERDFGAPLVTEDRLFEYDGSGYLDIDDASDITAVALTYPLAADITLDSTDWTAKPARRDDAPVYTYIVMPGYVGAVTGSPEMGFTRNADVYARERGSYAMPNTVKVTATWGWPDVPEAVQQAAVWTLQEWKARPTGEGLTAESIEGWSRAWGGRGVSAAALAIPERARDVLANFARISV